MQTLNGPAKDLLSNIVSQTEKQTAKTLSKALDDFVRNTDGGKQVTREIGLYANLPYFVAGMATMYLLTRLTKR